MTKKVTIEILDDTDGSPAEQTIPFGLDGVSYEIDLSSLNAEALRTALAPFVSTARRTGGRRIRVAIGQATDNAKEASQPTAEYAAAHDIRSWAQRNGYVVAEQGRISKKIAEAYRESHLNPSPTTARKPRSQKNPSQSSKRKK
jgi:hypothetical protein